MNGISCSAELLSVANNPKYSETGGGHGAKGVDFARWWAVVRMLELEKANEPDFLLLFESVQDVAELDSASVPTRAKVYQIKKKDSGTWKWSVLTGTIEPKSALSATKKTPDFKNVSDSPLGKLRISLNAFTTLPVEGIFLSNAGCAFPLKLGGSAATTLPCTLADLAVDHVKLLHEAFATLSASGLLPDLAKMKLQKVAIHPDNLQAPAIAAALELLVERSPSHAGQASAFVESLVMKISPLTRRTDVCRSFDELVKERGFSRNAFLKTLTALETVPDRNALLSDFLNRLQNEGLDYLSIASLRVEAARVQQERLLGGTDLSRKIDYFSDEWLKANSPTTELRPYIEAALTAIKAEFSGRREIELKARFVMRAITKCVGQN